MNLQFILDSAGETTGVYIPIKEWNELKSRFKDIEQEETSIPDWHKAIVRERLVKHSEDTSQALDFDQAMDDIENSL